MGLPKKTKAFSLCKFYKGFRDPRRERYLRPVLLHIGELVQIVVDDQMIVPVQGRQSGLGIRQIELIAGGVLAWLLHRSEENRIILFFRAQHIVPLLNKQDGGFRSCIMTAATLNFVTVLVLASSYGFGIAFTPPSS